LKSRCPQKFEVAQWSDTEENSRLVVVAKAWRWIIVDVRDGVEMRCRESRQVVHSGEHE
jgi:hypothetical protein